MEPESLMTVPEAAAYIGCHERTIHCKVADGELTPYRKTGSNSILFDRREVEELARPRPVRKTFETVEARIRRIVAQAPPLTNEQVDRIVALLRSSTDVQARAS